MPYYPPTVAATPDSDATVTFTDITTNNSSTSKHGFLKRLDNTATNYMDGTGAWSVPTGSSASLLAVASINTSTNYTTTSSTQADVDATNAIITFTAPATGKILVRVTCTVNVNASFNANCFWGIRESTTDVVNKNVLIQSQTTNIEELVCSVAAYLTGVSAGSHTYKLAFASNSGESLIIRSAAATPIVMEIWGAP